MRRKCEQALSMAGFAHIRAYVAYCSSPFEGDVKRNSSFPLFSKVFSNMSIFYLDKHVIHHIILRVILILI